MSRLVALSLAIVVGLVAAALDAAICDRDYNINDTCFTWPTGGGDPNPYPGYCCTDGGVVGGPVATSGNPEWTQNSALHCGHLWRDVMGPCDQQFCTNCCGGPTISGACTRPGS
jgi:hypothetical protein